MPDTLNGLPVVITRQREQAAELAGLVDQKGGRPLLIPLIRTEFYEPEEIATEAAQIDSADWIIFSSANGVKGFSRLNGFRRDSKIKIAAVGNKTAAALKAAGFTVDLVPEKHSAMGLLTEMEGIELRGKHCLLPGPQQPRPELAAGLKARRAQVTPLPLYRTIPETEVDRDALFQIWAGTDAACITFFSPSAVDALRALTGDSRPGNKRLIFAPVGGTTAAALREAQLPVHFTPSIASARGLVDGLITFLMQN